MPQIVDNEFSNILIIKPSAAGDIICALPILAALRERYPSARISWMVAAHLADLLRGHPMIDELIEFDRRRFGYIARSWAVTRRFMRFLQRLRAAKYDLVVDLQGLFRSGFLAWTTQAEVRIGPAEKRELGWIFYTHRCPARPKDTHTVDKMYSAGELLGLDVADPKFPVAVGQHAKENIHALLRDKLGERDRSDNYIALAPGGTWTSKRWPADKFAQLARMIVSELDIPVIIVGGRAERRLGAEIVEQANNKNKDNRIVSIAGQTKLSELLAVINGAAALVCNDSGPMHMAVALDRPVTAIIGPTNPHRTGPYRRDDAVVKSKIDCSPCIKRRCTKAPAGSVPACMADITVQRVFENLTAQLAAYA